MSPGKRLTKLHSVTSYLTTKQYDAFRALMADAEITNESEMIATALAQYADDVKLPWPDDKLPRGRTPGVPQKRKSREIPPGKGG